MNARQILKILHTIAACGLIGGVACYMILLVAAPQDTPAAYADLRDSITVICNFVLLPSVAAAILSGLLSMVVHTPFLDKGWVLIKLFLGIPATAAAVAMLSEKAGHAARAARRIAEDGVSPDVLDALLAREWLGLMVIMLILMVNVVLGVWRPRIVKPSPSRSSRAVDAASLAVEQKS